MLGCTSVEPQVQSLWQEAPIRCRDGCELGALGINPSGPHCDRLGTNIGMALDGLQLRKTVS